MSDLHLNLNQVTKRCSRCEVPKPLGEFSRNRTTRDGLHSRCRECKKIEDAETRAKRSPEVSREHNRRYRQRDPNRRAKKLRQWRVANPEKDRAHWQLNRAVRSGRITKPTVCQRCGASGRITGHHPDYSKPLEVEWLCDKCHFGASHV